MGLRLHNKLLADAREWISRSANTYIGSAVTILTQWSQQVDATPSNINPLFKGESSRSLSRQVSNPASPHHSLKPDTALPGGKKRDVKFLSAAEFI
jgi:hypothetical protein